MHTARFKQPVETWIETQGKLFPGSSKELRSVERMT